MSKLSTRGSGNAQAKLNSFSVRSIRTLHEEQGIGYRKLSKWYKVSRSQIRRILLRENWAWL